MVKLGTPASSTTVLDNLTVSMTAAAFALTLLAAAPSVAADDDHRLHQKVMMQGSEVTEATHGHHGSHRQPGTVGEPPDIKPGETNVQDDLPIDVVLDERFSLIDQQERRFGIPELKGQMTLLFFGYANCDGVCLMALPNLAETAALLEDDGIRVKPVMVTIDPERDTPAVMRSELQALHPEFTGLTGSDQALSDVMALFSVRKRVLFHDPDGAPIYRHGTFVYLFDQNAQLLTVFPPILAPEDMARIVAGYTTRGGSAG
ncbi:MAG: SCO family protein [Pseudomonadota bacterium]